MAKKIEPIFDFNFNNLNNTREDVPFITISNSKSNSSKNQNSKTSSNNYKGSLTLNNNSSSNSKKNLQNSSFNIIRKQLYRNNNNINQTSSDIMLNLTNSIYDNINKTKSLSEDQKDIKTEIKTEQKAENETPKKKYNNNMNNYKKEKTKKKAILPANSIFRKNLMDYFGNMSVDFAKEEKNKIRVSSVENISNNTFKLKSNNNNVINKFLNKNIILPKKTIKIVNKNNNNNSKKGNEYNNIKKEINITSSLALKEKRPNSSLKKSSLKKFQNEFKLNGVNFGNLLNKYMPRKIDKNNNNIGFSNPLYFVNNTNCVNDVNKINSAKKISYEKIKKTPKSDNYKRKLSASYLKIRETVPKNLFHDYKPKQSEEININRLSNNKRLTAKVMKENKPTISSNLFDRLKNNKNNIFIKIRPDKKDAIENKNNIKRINNEINSNSNLKIKNQIEKINQPINIGFKYKNKNEKK